MHIAFDAKRLFRNFTGLGNYSRTLVHDLRRYASSDIILNLYSPRLSEDVLCSPFLDSKEYRHRTCPNSFRSYWRSYGLNKFLLEDQVDVFHGLSNELPFGLSKRGIPSVVTIHDLIFKVYPETYPWIDRQIYDYKFRSACERADLVLAISESTKRDIIKYYNIPEAKIKVQYQTVSPLFRILSQVEFKEQVKKQFKLPELFYLSVGSLTERKNIGGLIDAYKQLGKPYQIPLYIIGNGNLAKELRAKVYHYGLENKIHILNQTIDNHTLKAFYELATILIYPSLYEGFGLPVLEASFLKTLSITSNTSSLPEAGGKYCTYFDPTSTASLVETIQYLMDDKERRNQLEELAYDWAHEKFNPQILTESLLECYRVLK